MKKLIKLIIIYAYVVCYCTVCITANGEGNHNRVIRQEYWILVIQNESGLLGYYDTVSGYYQTPEYNSIFDNPDYGAPLLVEKEGLWGYIDRTTGEQVIPFEFTAAGAYSDFKNGYAVIGYIIDTNDGSTRYRSVLIDMHGNQITIPENYSIVSGVCGSRKTVIIYGSYNDRFGYGIFQIGKGVIIEPTYDDIWFGDCNYFCFRDTSGMVGIIDADGHVILEPQYHTNGGPIQYLCHENGTSSLHIDGYYKVYNEHGQAIYILIDNTRDCFTVFDVDMYPG